MSKRLISDEAAFEFFTKNKDKSFPELAAIYLEANKCFSHGGQIANKVRILSHKEMDLLKTDNRWIQEAWKKHSEFCLAKRDYAYAHKQGYQLAHVLNMITKPAQDFCNTSFSKIERARRNVYKLKGLWRQWQIFQKESN